MAQHQLETKHIGLELTESALIDGDEHSITSIHALKEMGFEIALDDFGTGYFCPQLTYIMIHLF